MKEFVLKLFSEHNSTNQIDLFDGWHFLYLFIVFGGAILLSLTFRHRSDRAKTNLLRVMACLTIGLYIADFFIMPLSDSYNGISIDKLPFHICTFMGVLVPFAQFNKAFAKIKAPIVTLSIAATLMWMCYPGSALGGQPPFCYLIFQTFMYHGLLFNWGVLNLSLGAVKLDIRKIWMELCGILIILVWSMFGNAIYNNQNWFFTKHSIFEFIPDEIMPPVVVVCVFSVCLAVYGAYYLFSSASHHADQRVRSSHRHQTPLKAAK